MKPPKRPIPRLPLTHGLMPADRRHALARATLPGQPQTTGLPPYRLPAVLSARSAGRSASSAPFRTAAFPDSRIPFALRRVRFRDSTMKPIPVRVQDQTPRRASSGGRSGPGRHDNAGCRQDFPEQIAGFLRTAASVKKGIGAESARYRG